MNRPVTGAATAPERSHPAADIVTFFKARASLVIAAVVALDEIAAHLASLADVVDRHDVAAIRYRRNALDISVNGAMVSGDNLLVARPSFAADPFVLCSVSRMPSGVVDLRTIELDRDTVAIAGAPGKYPRALDALSHALDACRSPLDDAIVAVVRNAADAAATQVRSVLSRLSIIKARLDLQESFLAAIVEEDMASAPIQVDSHLDHSGARGMALAARRVLSAGSHKIASSHRDTDAPLFVLPTRS